LGNDPEHSTQPFAFQKSALRCSVIIE
jgi:hypothetical protein